MFDTEPHTERHAAILAELAEIGMVMARGLREEVETAETPEARARAVATFPRLARAVRQTLALETRFRRDAARDRVAADARVATEMTGQIRRRKAQVRLWMQRAICNETPDDKDVAEARLYDLYERLDDAVLEEDFARAPFPQVIAYLHRELGLTPATFGDADDDDRGGDGDDDDQDDEAPDDEASDNDDPAEDPPPDRPPTAPHFRYSYG